MDRYTDEPQIVEKVVDERVAFLYPLAYILLLISSTWGLCQALGLNDDDYRSSRFYGVEIVGVKAANPQDEEGAWSSSPRFDLTARLSNHYRGQKLRTLCLTNWESSISYDGIPLGQGSFPRTVCVGKSGEATVTATTSTELVGLAKEVHLHMAATHESTMGELQLQIDMSFVANLIGNDDKVYDTRPLRLWCTSGTDAQSAPTSCRLNMPSPSMHDIEFI
uniref:Uncharacterized protein n=1 Tax=Avena sativa TaxID=4498 RepID=A0ACD5VQK2_AVESA